MAVAKKETKKKELVEEVEEQIDLNELLLDDSSKNENPISEIISKEIIKGDVVSEFDVVTASGIFTSVITTRSVEQLDLQIGSQVIVLIKSTDVSLAKL